MRERSDKRPARNDVRDGISSDDVASSNDVPPSNSTDSTDSTDSANSAAASPNAGSPRVASTRTGSRDDDSSSDGQARIAAFDLDGTLINGQSGSLVLRYLFSHGLVTKGAFFKSAWWGFRYKFHLPHRQSEVREIIMDELKVHPATEVRSILQSFHDEIILPRYRADGLAELAACRDAGMHVVIVSATFDAIAQASCAYVGADKALATIMEVDERGYYTGRVKGEVTAGAEKLRRTNEYGDQRFGAGNWVLERAYGDHYTDAPLLEQARTCYAVDPSHTLKKEAARRGWTVLTWR